MYRLSILLLALVLTACSTSKRTTTSFERAQLLDRNTFLLKEVSDDATYGYTQANPIKVGGAKEQEGPVNERRFLNALAGPDGEVISYHRSGSCCAFKTRNSPFGGGLLDVYMVAIDGSTDTVRLYINMYDVGPLKAPVGFTIKKRITASGENIAMAELTRPVPTVK